MNEKKAIGELVLDGIKPTKKRKALKVEVVEFNVGFLQLVKLMVRAALAAIPAMILLSVLYAFFAAMGLGFLLRH